MTHAVAWLRSKRGSWGKWVLLAIVVNEVRGLVCVVVTWPAWWPVLKAAWHAVGR